MSAIVGLDYETETDAQGNCRPLLCCLNGENKEMTYELTNRSDFIDYYIQITTSGDTYVVYNASFDIEIIMIMLLKNGYGFLRATDDPCNKTMKVIMSQKIYLLTIYTNVRGKLVETRFMDLANLIVDSNLAKIAEAFTELRKGNFEEEKQHPERFKLYCMNDAKITRIAYQTVLAQLGADYITVGSAAFDIMLKMNFKGKTKKARFSQFKAVYGYLTIEDDDRLRKWYAGGFGWCSTDERTELRIHSYDLKSAYPYECMGRLPTYNQHLTLAHYEEPNAEYPFAFYHMRITGQVKKNHCPPLPSRNIYGDSNVYIYDDKDVYIIREYGVVSEYDMFFENVEIEEIEYVSTVLMKEATVNPLAAFVNKYYAIKSTSKGIEREFAKRLLNALTGKLGTNPRKSNVGFELDDNSKLFKAWEEETITPSFAPHVVSVITSRVRTRCYIADSKLRDLVDFRFYCTDSCKHSSSVKVLTSGKGLGDWALEYEHMEFIYLGLKAYIFDPNDEQGCREVMCAGISKKYKDLITNEQFYASTEVKSMISVRAGNGRIIYEGTKHIVSPVKKPRRRAYG